MKSLLSQPPFATSPLLLPSFLSSCIVQFLPVYLSVPSRQTAMPVGLVVGLASRDAVQSQWQTNNGQRIIILSRTALLWRTSQFICRNREINICRCNISWSIAMSKWLETSGSYDWCVWLIAESHAVCINIPSFQITSYVRQSNRTCCPISSTHWNSFEKQQMNGMWIRSGGKKKAKNIPKCAHGTEMKTNRFDLTYTRSL